MIDPAEVIRRQLPYVNKLYADEAWYEGERRGGHVPRHDPQVRRRVAEILLEKGEELRQRVEAEMRATHIDADLPDGPPKGP
jgi:hypothetical protein